MTFLKNVVSICFVIALPLQGSSAANYYAVTHPSYSGKLLQHPFVERILLFNVTLKNSSVSAPSVVHRDTLDAKCRMKCLTMDGGPCNTFQTYWTVDGTFYCELLNTTLCDSCSLMGNQAVGQLQSRVWENIQPDGFDPVRPCSVLPDWKVPGNCSLCGKIGFYGRNCSLRSTCASYFYETASPVANLSVYANSAIAPCFTQGRTIYTWCRGPFTYWLASSNTSIITGPWSHSDVFAAKYSSLLTEFEETRQVIGPTERNLLVAVYPLLPKGERLLLYSGFSLGPQGSLTIRNFVSGTGATLLADAFQTPIVDIPFLRPMNNTCGPMWLLDQSVFNNSTQIDSCASQSRFFGNASKWATVNVSTVVGYIEIDCFQC